GPAQQAESFGGALQHQLERLDLHAGPLPQPQADGRLSLDLLVIADDRLPDTTEQSARGQSLLERGGDGRPRAAVVRREKDQRQVRPQGRRSGHLSADLVEGPFRLGLRGDGGGKRHGELPASLVARLSRKSTIARPSLAIVPSVQGLAKSPQ